MKTKVIIQIIAVLVIGLTSSFSYASDDFYYGSFHCLGLGNGETDYLTWQKDSLKFNLGLAGNINSSNIQYFVNASMRVIPENEITDISPNYWSKWSHYTLWEAERYPESNYHLHYDGGVLVTDTSASSGKAMKFNDLSTRLLQWGPSYKQERNLPGDTVIISYTAEFNLKFISALYDPPNQKSGNPPVPVCSLMVVDTVSHTILKHKTLFRSDFPRRDYKPFYLEDYTVSSENRIDFQIYLFGTTAAYYFYIDYVKVYDQNGWELVDQKWHDQVIMAYVDSNWVHTTLPNGKTAVCRWYLKDEPYLIDHYAPYNYVDSILKSNPPYIPGIQSFYWHFDDTLITHEYVVRTEPVQYMMHNFPFRGDDSNLNYQPRIDTLIKNLNECKIIADSMNKDFWVGIQAHAACNRKTGSCLQGETEYEYPQGSGTIYCCWHRDPTKYEVRLQTFLALCYGADAINNYRFSFEKTDGYLETGLYDGTYHSDSSKFQEIAHFTGPRARSLGQQIKPLTWQGACANEEVGSFVLLNSQPSYIDSIVGIRHPDSTYVQVGFFNDSDTSYFMLVNRKCLEGEDETLKVYFDIPNGPYLLRDMYTDQPSYTFYANCPSIISLKPGEGRLFRIEQYPFSIHVKKVPQTYSVIQNAINAAQDNDTVLVAPETYSERINFRGKPIPVASYYILLGEQHYKNYTCIDAQHGIPTLDSASVVTFSSGEDSNSAIEGFTLKNGKGTILPFKSEDRYGGGIYCEGSSPTIRNNIIQGNQADAERYSSGGGIYCTGCNPGPTITCNLIRNNTSIYGGGICCNASSASIINNLIINNSALSFEKDTSLDDGGYGGGIECDARSKLTVVNNTLDDNYAYIYGGGIDIHGSSHVLFYNNIVSNTNQGDGIYVHSSTDTALISYNNFWNNFEDDIDGIVNSAIGDTTWGNNRNGTPCDTFYNIFRNPEFVNGYHLDSSSACVNAGDNNAPDLPEFDYDGNPRVVDFVDMGACEYQGGGSGNKNAKIVGNTDSNNPPLPTSVPKEFKLSQSYPNPFNPVAVIEFTIGNEQPYSRITLKIFNITGQLVRTLVDEEKTPGTYTVTWDGKNNSNEEVASGVYFYELKSNNLRESKRMVLIK